MSTSACIRGFVEDMLKEGHRRFLFDLESCTAMDSTFIGIMAGVSMYQQGEGVPQVIIVNASPKNRKPLEDLGLAELVVIHDGKVEPPPVTTQRIYDEPAEEERIDLVREAHRNLMRVSSQNEERFGKFLDTLDKEVKRKKEQG